MPRVTQRKARKDYPIEGIKKGDLYFYTALKLQRGGIVKRSLTPFKQSQLTNSPFKSGWYSTQEAWDASDRNSGDMTETAEAFREIGAECQNSFDSMPEGLQQGDTGQLLGNRAEESERIADELDELATEFDALEEPDQPNETFDPSQYDADVAEMEGEEAAEFLLERETEYDELMSDYQGLFDEFESEQERLRGEADDLAGEMPE
jgi:hypothetical protein